MLIFHPIHVTAMCDTMKHSSVCLSTALVRLHEHYYSIIECEEFIIYTSVLFTPCSSVFPQLYVKKDEPCRVLCTVELQPKVTNTFINRIDEDYTIHM